MSRTSRWRHEIISASAAKRFSFLYDAKGDLVTTMKTTDASRIVCGMNYYIDQQEERINYLKKKVKIGDRIGRKMCGGAKGTFIFTGWDGDLMCGKSISDCHPMCVYAVNGVQLNGCF